MSDSHYEGGMPIIHNRRCTCEKCCPPKPVSFDEKIKGHRTDALRDVSERERKRKAGGHMALTENKRLNKGDWVGLVAMLIGLFFCATGTKLDLPGLVALGFSSGWMMRSDAAFGRWAERKP